MRNSADKIRGTGNPNVMVRVGVHSSPAVDAVEQSLHFDPHRVSSTRVVHAF